MPAPVGEASRLSEQRLLSRHGRLLLYVHRHPGQTAAEIANGLSLNLGSIWSVIGDLRSRDMLLVRLRNRRHTYFANMNAMLTDPIGRTVTVRAILEGLTGNEATLSRAP